MGFSESPRNDIYGTDGQNLYNNPFANTSMLVELSNGGIARMSENRCLAWHFPVTYVSQFYGTEGSYEFSVANHFLSHWQEENPHKVDMKDVSAELLPESLTALKKENYEEAVRCVGNGYGFREVSPIQPVHRLPKEFEGLPNGHNGTHQFLIDDFCKAYATGKLSPTNIWAVARFNLPGLIAHQSALQGGKVMDVPDLGAPPADWEVLP